MKTIYLHIGCEKTGTTSIQHFLTSNRKALELQGIAYPKLGLNKTAQFNLAASINSWQNKCDSVDYYPKKSISIEQEWAQFKRFYDETSCNKIVISAEHFSSRLREAGIKRLKAELDKIAQDVELKVILYIRRQDWFIESSYSTAIKAGSTSLFDDFFIANVNAVYRYDFSILLQSWSEVFSDQNILVADYDDILSTRSLIPHFCKVIGADTTSLTPENKIENPTWSPAMLEFVRLSNSPKMKQQLGGNRLDFFNYINEIQSTENIPKSCLMTPTQRQLVLEKYKQSNDAVQNKYFTGHQLFAKAKDPSTLILADNTQCTRQYIIELLVKTYLDTQT